MKIARKSQNEVWSFVTNRQQLGWVLAGFCFAISLRKSQHFLNKRETERIEGAKAKLIKLVTLSQGF